MLYLPHPPQLRSDAPEPFAQGAGLLDVIDGLWDSKWLIAGIALLATAAACAYIAFVPPSYEGSALIQVEEGKPTSTGSTYADAANLFENRAPAIAEMSILRSGLVLGDVVDRLHLDLYAQAKYVPVIGQWLARRATQPSEPGFLGMPGYVRGNEKIKLALLQVPQEAEGRTFDVVLADSGYDLRDPAGQLLLHGSMGRREQFRTEEGTGQILVESAVGRPGATFEVRRLARGLAIEKLQRALKIEEQGKQSGILRMRLAGSDPEAIATTLNEIGRSYVRQNIARKTAEAEKALAFLEGVLPNLRNEIVQAEAKLTQFRNQHGTFDLTAEGRIALEQSVRLQMNLMELQNKRRDLSTNWASDHPGMRALDAQIASVTAALGGVNRHVRVLPALEQDMLGLTRELKVNSELYANLLNSAQQIRLAKEGRVANVRLVDYAWASHEPAGPRPPALLAAGASGGLVLGVLLALLRRGLRRGVQDPEWIESRTDLNVLATVPHSRTQQVLANTRRRLGQARVLAVRAPHDPAVESLRSVRTALQRKLPEAGSNIVLITGPTHGIGKSFTSANLAAVLGAVSRRVLLVDADMRKGRLAECFSVPAAPGLSDVLSGRSLLAEALCRDVAPNVDLIPAGSASASIAPADLLTAPATEQLLRSAAAEYDFVIVDTPPVLAASDAAILAQWAGAVFMIARADVTSLRELHEAQKRLSQRGTRVDGVIYTGVDVSRRRNEIYSYGAYEYKMPR